MILNYDNNKHNFFFLTLRIQLTCFLPTFCTFIHKRPQLMCSYNDYCFTFYISNLYFLKFQHFSRENFRQTIFVVCLYRNMCVFFFTFYVLSVSCVGSDWKALCRTGMWQKILWMSLCCATCCSATWFYFEFCSSTNKCLCCEWI